MRITDRERELLRTVAKEYEEGKGGAPKEIFAFWVPKLLDYINELETEALDNADSYDRLAEKYEELEENLHG